jgi:enoyl-CoA hydratase/carnithine racemase
VVLEQTERGRVVYLRVPRPAALGTASTRLAGALRDACLAIAARPLPPVAVALVGGGEAFCARPPGDAADCDAAAPAWAEVTAAVARLAPPTVAAIGGDAVGPAWELALACDLRLAAATARVGSPEVRWGRLPAAGGTQRLTRLVGPAEALRLLLLGELLAVPAALAHGLVHRVVAPADVEPALETLLDGLRTAAPIALAYAKEAVHAAVDTPLPAGLRLEADLAALLQTTTDRAEGIAAFRARRPPRFEGQ